MDAAEFCIPSPFGQRLDPALVDYRLALKQAGEAASMVLDALLQWAARGQASVGAPT
jgi:hypothetical protein